ncbi:MAG: hypothetical protein Tsb0010_14530 [Parvularculaceae bacterium]
MNLSVIGLALCLVLAASARYATEISVKNARAELAQLQLENAALSDKRAVLRAEIAYLENPARLAALARAGVGLAPAEPHQFVGMSRAIAIVEGRAQARRPEFLAQAFDPFAELANFDRTEPPSPVPNLERDPAVLTASWPAAEAL